MRPVVGSVCIACSRQTCRTKPPLYCPLALHPFPGPAGEFNPFQVNIISCSNGALKLEWSSSKARQCASLTRRSSIEVACFAAGT